MQWEVDSATGDPLHEPGMPGPVSGSNAIKINWSVQLKTSFKSEYMSSFKWTVTENYRNLLYNRRYSEI